MSDGPAPEDLAPMRGCLAGFVLAVAPLLLLAGFLLGVAVSELSR